MMVAYRACLVCLVVVFLGASAVEQRFRDRLMMLRPADAQAYFRLGEDIAELAQTEADRALAIRLFALADHLDPHRYRRSAVLAIRPLVDDPAVQRLLDADLRAWSGIVEFLPSDASGDDRGDEVVLAAVEALSALRRGDRHDLESALEQDGVAARLDAMRHQLPGDTVWMLRKVGTARPGKQLLDEVAIMSTLKVQSQLLGSRDQPWSVVLHSRHGEPMTVIDPVPLVEIFSINPSKATWRGGRWE